MFCNICGAQIEDDLKFCTQCGSPVTSNTPPVYTSIEDNPTELFTEENAFEVPTYPMPVTEGPIYDNIGDNATELFTAETAYEIPTVDEAKIAAPAYEPEADNATALLSDESAYEIPTVDAAKIAVPAYEPEADNATALLSDESAYEKPTVDTPEIAVPAYEPAVDNATELFDEETAYEIPTEITSKNDAVTPEAPVIQYASLTAENENTSSKGEDSAEETNTNVSPKNRKTALILAILFGYMGINRLYLGAKGGVLRLILYILALICCAMSSLVVPLIIAIPLYIITMVGGISDIIKTAKGTMVDKEGLLVTKW